MIHINSSRRYCAGLVGGTAKDISVKLLNDTRKQDIISSLFPDQKAEQTESNNENAGKADTKLVVVVLCGLNDWRTALERFPYGSGLETFQLDLHNIIEGKNSIFL